MVSGLTKWKMTHQSRRDRFYSGTDGRRTDRIAPFLKDDMSEMDRGAIIDSISAVIVKEAVAGTKLSGQVQPMFEGNQFFLFLYTIYKDVRW